MLRALKALVPPAIYRAPLLRRPLLALLGLGHSGDFASYDQVMGRCGSGYADPSLSLPFERKIDELLKGGAPRGITPGIFRLAYWISRAGEVAGAGPLKVVDFGGGLGQFYFEAREHAGRRTRWMVVETAPMAEAGRRRYASDELSFATEIPPGPADLVLASGVLQYVRDPYETLGRLLDLVGPGLVVVDRFPLVDRETDRLTHYKITRRPVKTASPCWFFSREKFLKFVASRGFEVAAAWDLEESLVLDWKTYWHSGVCLRRK